MEVKHCDKHIYSIPLITRDIGIMDGAGGEMHSPDSGYQTLFKCKEDGCFKAKWVSIEEAGAPLITSLW